MTIRSWSSIMIIRWSIEVEEDQKEGMDCVICYLEIASGTRAVPQAKLQNRFGGRERRGNAMAEVRMPRRIF
jgi:hypothetical protein